MVCLALLNCDQYAFLFTNKSKKSILFKKSTGQAISSHYTLLSILSLSEEKLLLIIIAIVVYVVDI